jgi:hypothetical protein
MDRIGESKIELASLAPVVRRALGAPDAEVLDWRVAPLGGGTGVALGAGTLHRVSGTARDDDTVQVWSIVHKRLRPPAVGAGFSLSGDDPTSQTYWKREALVYSSELLRELPAGFVAPRCHGIDERTDGIVLWLEDVVETENRDWSLARYGEIARHLGRFNGAYIAGRPMPDAPWLCRDMARWREPLVAPFWDRIAELRTGPRVQRGWPGDLLDRAHRVWIERERFYSALASVPQVLCHGDTDRRNLMLRHGADGLETVAIDWAYVGPQAVGTDAMTLAVQGVLWARHREPDELPSLSRACLEGYLAGLRDAGWIGDERPVRLGFLAGAALRFVALTGPILVALASEDERPRIEAAFGTTLEAILDRYAAMQPFLLDAADETRLMLDGG